MAAEGEAKPTMQEDATHGITNAHYTVTSSTMDRAKELCKTHAADKWLSVTAGQQVSGRGTNGRTWVSPAGNSYLSICVPKAALPMEKLMYLPLYVGVAVSDVVRDLIPGAGLVKEGKDKVVVVKWPNDVLVGGEKVSGNLIEDGLSHMVVGIGVNVETVPEVTDGGRPATSLKTQGSETTAAEASAAVVRRLKALLTGPQTATPVDAYAQRMDWASPVNQRNPDNTRGPAATPIRLTPEGHLVVRTQDSTEKTLISEYLF